MTGLAGRRAELRRAAPRFAAAVRTFRAGRRDAPSLAESLGAALCLALVVFFVLLGSLRL